MRLTADEVRSRLRFDWQVASGMFGDVFHGSAFRNAEDLEHDRRPITSVEDADRAYYYQVTYKVPTLVGPGKFQPQTVVGFNVNVGGYPFSDPAVWVIGPKAPWSPHFRAGAPVCLGTMWSEGRGAMLLGELMVHVARLLNWDERMHPGYEGWNGDAIRYWRKTYQGQALDAGLRYPTLPAELTHGVDPQAALFVPTGHRDSPDLFGPASSLFESR